MNNVKRGSITKYGILCAWGFSRFFQIIMSVTQSHIIMHDHQTSNRLLFEECNYGLYDQMWDSLIVWNWSTFNFIVKILFFVKLVQSAHVDIITCK